MSFLLAQVFYGGKQAYYMVWNLPLQIIDVLRATNPIYVLPNANIGELRRLVRDYKVRVIPVVADEKSLKLLGIVARRSLLLSSSTRSPLTAKDIMEDPRLSANPSSDARRHAKRMLELDAWYTPVLDDQHRLIGMLGLEDYISWIIDNEPSKLEKPVTSFMSENPVSVTADTPVYKVWQIMLSKGFAALPVVNNDGRLVGVIAEYDLVVHGFTRPELEPGNIGVRKGPQIREVMSTPPVTVEPAATLLEAARLMVSRDIGRVYVVEDGRLVGVVDRSDVLKAWLTSR